MSLKRKLFEGVMRPIRSCFRVANRMNVNFIEGLQPVYTNQTPHGPIKFFCPNSLNLWRAQTLLTKEPDTIAWIDGFDEKDVFFDVGANVGVFSLYAGVKGARVYAFEPESQNYAILNKNIYINNMMENVTSYNIALNDKAGIDRFYLSDFNPGAALHNYGSNTDYRHNKFDAKYVQGVAAYSLDDVIALGKFPAPDHLKIDVDGLESAIIKGASNLLKGKKLKTILLELNSDLESDRVVIDHLQQYGYSRRSVYSDPALQDSEYASLGNHIFVREDL